MNHLKGFKADNSYPGEIFILPVKPTQDSLERDSDVDDMEFDDDDNYRQKSMKQKP